MKKSLETVLCELDALHCHFSKPEFVSWLFEYACQTVEYEGLNPTETTSYVNWLMVNKADRYRKMLEKVYFKNKANYMQINWPRKEDIPAIVKEEHKNKGYLGNA